MSRLFHLFAAAILASSSASAQIPGLTGGSGGLGGLGGLLGGNLGSTGLNNATGVLGYCVKNKLMREQQGLASGVLGKLTGQQPSIKSSPGFLDGQNGLLRNGGDKLSLDSLPSGLKAKACDLVLSKAQSFL